MRRSSTKRTGLTLMELVVSTVILMIAGFPVMMVFRQSNQTIKKTDERREGNFYINTIFSHINRTSLHFLWDNFGPPEFEGAGYMRDRLAETDEAGNLTVSNDPRANPLGFPEEFLQDLVRDGYEARIRFEFFTKTALRSQTRAELKDLSVKLDEVADPKIGILHMQSGWAMVTLYDKKSIDSGTPVILDQDVQVIMCPAIVGRPGMKLASCPALSSTVKAKYDPLLATREAALGANPPW